MTFAQADTRTAAVLVDELDAGQLQGAPRLSIFFGLAILAHWPSIASMAEIFPPAYELTTRPSTSHAGRYRWIISGDGLPAQTSLDTFETPEKAIANGRKVLEKLIKASRIGQ